MKKIIFIYGPTSSGKTHLSNILANISSAHIINADSMQVYDQIKILNASPSDVEKKANMHFLFNFFSIYENYSLDSYVRDVKNILDSSESNNYIIVGGTGMYISGLLNGVTKIPQIEQEIREFVRDRFISLGNSNFYSELSQLDQNVIGKIHPNNSHKVIRAYEVIKSTGKSIFEFLESSSEKSILENSKIIKIYLKPDRNFLYDLCNQRFDYMIKNGAIDEVLSVADDFNELSQSVKKIIGLEEIYEYVNNRKSLKEAIEIAKQRTRNYSKRQYTWFSHQIQPDIQLEFKSLSEYETQINSLVKKINEFII